MNLNDAEALTLRTMRKHGLTEKTGWRFRFDQAFQRLGCVRGWKRVRGGTIQLSRDRVLMMKREYVLEVILHEIAHALVGLHHGHNDVWRAKALELGANTQPTFGKTLPAYMIDPEFVTECRQRARARGRESDFLHDVTRLMGGWVELDRARR